MIYKNLKAALERIKKYRVEIFKTSVLLFLTLGGCLISFMAGRHMRPDGAMAVNVSAASPAEAETIGQTLKEPPFFAFPACASYSNATPANADMMRPDQLNLAYLYEPGADTSAPSDSIAGRLYKEAAEMDTRWISGIYDLYDYTPARLASQLEMPVESVTTPSGVIEEFDNVQVYFRNGDGQIAGAYSNAKSIISMANLLYYYGVLEDMEELEDYVSQLWEHSHSCSVNMGMVYYCDAGCKKEQQDDSEHTETEGFDTEQTEGPANGAAEAPKASASTAIEDPRGESSPEKAEESSGDYGPLGDGMVSGGEETLPESASALCPGHIDFTINITVKGIDENNNLFLADEIPAFVSEEEGLWNGWNNETAACVRTLSSEDWYGKYELNTSDLLMRNPLTSADIDIYMNMVPDDVSPVRRTFVKYALSSVGKIPYYWGGKPEVPGYTGNNFGSVIPPDEDGRYLKGLDCSGWINWVYWSVTGRGLGAESTGTLLAGGKAVTRDQLIPGDICIRTGPSAHVVIFLGWAEDGQMVCIQETSGGINNVEVGITASDWQSYRRILD